METLAERNIAPLPVVETALNTVSTQTETSCIERLMSTHSSRQTVKAGATIFIEGDNAEVIYHVVSGVIRCCRITADGRRQISRFIASGEEMGMTAFKEYGYTAEAITDVVLQRCSRSAFERAMQHDAQLREAVFEHMAMTLNSSRNQIVLLGQLTAAERAASFLLEMFGRVTEPSGEITLPMTRQDIADYLGMTLETVSRMFNKLKKTGVISMPSPDRIQVRDIDELETLAAAA